MRILSLISAAFLSLNFCFAQGGYEILVNSRATNSIKAFAPNGNFLGDFITSGSGGLSLPEDILFHPNGNLVVSGFGNQFLKSYDYQTGAFLGNFSSGYQLQSPSKISIGPDSLIYVTQWGTSQSKVVRFDLQGNFIDEFTSVDVNKGLSHLWDADGNFYIAAFADGNNGFIHHFDSLGNDLGPYLGSAKMDGPTTIWWGDSMNLFICDWTKGFIMQFDSAKNYHGQWNTGSLSQPEGMARTPNGDYLIGDWGLDKVLAFDSNGVFISEAAVGDGLADPNAVRVRSSTGLGLNEIESWGIRIARLNQGLRLHTSATLEMHISVVSINGHPVWKGQIHGHGPQETIIPLDGNLPAGIYLLHVASTKHQMSHSFYWGGQATEK